MDKLLDESCGKKIAEWAKGGTTTKPAPSTVPPAENRSEGNVEGQSTLFDGGKGSAKAIKCPNKDNKWRPITDCQKCDMRQGCPAHEAA